MDTDWLSSLLLHKYDIRQLLAQIKREREELGGVPRLFAPEIIADHQEMADHRINPNDDRVRILPDNAELRRRKAAHPLAPLASKLARRLGAVPGSSRMLALVDRDGFVLDIAGDSSMKHRASAFSLVSGVYWADVPPSTNAVRMSVKLKSSALILGPLHYRRNQWAVACHCVPVFGSNGRLVGFLDVVCPALAMTVDLPRLVDEVALNIRPDVDRVHHEQLNQLRQEAGKVLRRQYAKGLLVIDWHGWVAAAREWDADHRVAAPAGGFRLGHNDLPALGEVTLEPVPGGWLVREREPDEFSPTFQLTLTPWHRNPSRGRAGWITVNGPAVEWAPRELSLKQAEILLLLARSGRDGLTEADLARELYPEPPAPSTARSACQRIRDVLGSVLVSNPYRVSEHIEVTVKYPANMADLLPASVAPGIVRLRR